MSVNEDEDDYDYVNNGGALDEMDGEEEEFLGSHFDDDEDEEEDDEHGGSAQDYNSRYDNC